MSAGFNKEKGRAWLAKSTLEAPLAIQIIVDFQCSRARHQQERVGKHVPADREGVHQKHPGPGKERITFL